MYATYQEAEENYRLKKAVKIVNIKQIAFYCKYCQPDFVWFGYDNKLVFYYDKFKTIHAWREWQNSRPTKEVV